MLQADKLTALITAAKIPDVEPIWASLFAKALEGKDVKDMLMNVGSGGGAAAAAPAGGAGAAAGGAAEEAPKEAEKEEGEFMNLIYLRACAVLEDEVLMSLCELQRRRSQTRTWASVSSTKRLRPPISTAHNRDSTGKSETDARTALLCCCELLDYVAANATQEQHCLEPQLAVRCSSSTVPSYQCEIGLLNAMISPQVSSYRGRGSCPAVESSHASCCYIWYKLSVKPLSRPPNPR